MNETSKILKMFVTVGILLVAILYILLVLGVVAGAEFQDTLVKITEIIGTITVASIVVLYVTSIGNKK